MDPVGDCRFRRWARTRAVLSWSDAGQHHTALLPRIACQLDAQLPRSRVQAVVRGGPPQHARNATSRRLGDVVVWLDEAELLGQAGDFERVEHVGDGAGEDERATGFAAPSVEAVGEVHAGRVDEGQLAEVDDDAIERT